MVKHIENTHKCSRYNMRVSWVYCLERCEDRKRGACKFEAPRRKPRSVSG